MNYVQPIRDKKKIQTMKTVLKAKDEKYYIMFLVGINVGLRISDILTLKVSDVRDRAYKILNEAAQEIGLDEIGTHSMRKTFGYWHYQKYKDVALLQHLFNHANSAVTLRYIGVNQDIMDQSVSDFFL